MTRRSPAEYDWDKLQFDETLLTKHFSAINGRDIQFVVVHHMTIIGDGDGTSEGDRVDALDSCYNTWQTREASAHYGVDGSLVRQFVWDKDFAWATGSNRGNLNGLSIEHANAAGAPKWTVANTTWKTGAKLAGYICFVHKVGRPKSGTTLRKHSSFTATACPGPHLGDTIWAEYVAEAQRVYDSLTGGGTPTPDTEQAVWTDREDEYRVDITLPVYGRAGPHVDATKLTGALAIGSVIYATEITTQADGDWVRSKFGTCFKVSSLTLIGDEPTPEQPDPEPGATTYTVLPGDTLASIAARHGLTLAQLLALNGLDIIQPGLVLAVTDDTDPEPEPAPQPVSVTVTTAVQNMAANVYGIKTAKARIERYVAARKTLPVDVVSAQETTVASTIRSRLDSGLKPLGYKRAGGGKGRYVYTGSRLKVIASGLITAPKSLWYKGDDKQAAWVIYEVDGARGMDVSFHAEHENGATPDQLRVKQVRYFASSALVIAAQHDVLPQNVMLSGDTNSEGMVAAAMIAAGWRNVAAGTKYEKVYTFMGWDGRSRRRFDYGFVRHDALPAKLVALAHDTKISDHAGLRIVRKLI